MTEPIVVHAVRSGFVESEHLVDVAVVDEDGRTVAWAGDLERAAAFRSSSKPIQAAVSMDSGWEPPSDRALAIACASHSGEPGHLDAVREILGAAGVPEDELRCPAAFPFRPADAVALGAPARIVHNCSGKHAAMVACCAANGWPFEDYRAPAHPMQQAVRARMTAALGLVPDELIDGCGVRTFVAPLSALARAFATIGGGSQAAAMRAHPWLVGGTERFDSDLMGSSDLVAKGGAEGLSCVLAPGLSIAMKSRDGTARALPPAVMHVLSLLDLIPEDVLTQHREPPVLGGGEPVGVLRARGALARA